LAIAHEPVDDLTALRDLVQEHRRILEELEQKLSAHLPAEAAPLPDNVVPLPLAGSSARLARNEARRAARRARQATDEGIWVAFPATHQMTALDRDTQLREIADARRRIWSCCHDLLAELEGSTAGQIHDTLDEILRTELAIQAVVDGIELPLIWHDVADELSHASDVIIEAAREQLAVLARDPDDRRDVGAAVGRMNTAQSNWSRTWRTFVQVAPPGRR
jgi:hypothetical protein